MALCGRWRLTPLSAMRASRLEVGRSVACVLRWVTGTRMMDAPVCGRVDEGT